MSGPGLTVKQRVANGVAWLEGYVADWPSRLDLEALDVATTDRCVLGQLDEDLQGSRIFGALSDFGFYWRGRLPEFDPMARRDCDALNDEWRRVTRARLEGGA